MQMERWNSPLALKESNIVYLFKKPFSVRKWLFEIMLITFVVNKWNRMYDYRERGSYLWGYGIISGIPVFMKI